MHVWHVYCLLCYSRLIPVFIVLTIRFRQSIAWVALIVYSRQADTQAHNTSDKIQMHTT